MRRIAPVAEDVADAVKDGGVARGRAGRRLDGGVRLLTPRTARRIKRVTNGAPGKDGGVARGRAGRRLEGGGGWRLEGDMRGVGG
jgi:hypothetical protein